LLQGISTRLDRREKSDTRGKSGNIHQAGAEAEENKSIICDGGGEDNDEGNGEGCNDDGGNDNNHQSSMDRDSNRDTGMGNNMLRDTLESLIVNNAFSPKGDIR
jgi:hypothetical protein